MECYLEKERLISKAWVKIYSNLDYIIDYKNKLASEITYGVEANSVFKKK